MRFKENRPLPPLAPTIDKVFLLELNEARPRQTTGQGFLAIGKDLTVGLKPRAPVSTLLIEMQPVRLKLTRFRRTD